VQQQPFLNGPAKVPSRRTNPTLAALTRSFAAWMRRSTPRPPWHRRLVPSGPRFDALYEQPLCPRRSLDASDGNLSAANPQHHPFRRARHRGGACRRRLCRRRRRVLRPCHDREGRPWPFFAFHAPRVTFRRRDRYRRVFGCRTLSRARTPTIWKGKVVRNSRTGGRRTLRFVG
jgi:hypothetical protein